MNIKEMAREGRSIREIARMTGLARQTVRKVLQEVVPRRYGPRSRREGKLDQYQVQLRDGVARRPWQPASRFYAELKAAGYEGCYETVKVAVRGLRAEAQARSRACVRFETGPGEEAQFDWKGPVRGLLAEEPATEVYFFRLVLGYSRYWVTRVARGLTLPAVVADVMWGLEQLGGVPHRLVFDNFKAAVTRPRPHLVLNPQFLTFCQHYGLEPRPALPYRPQRKGKTERSFQDLEQAGVVHRTYANLTELQQVLEGLDAEHAGQVVSTTGARPVDRLERERPFLQPLPPHRFDARLVETRRVLSDCVISFRGATYSVPCQLVGRLVTVKVAVDETGFDIYDGATWVAGYQRQPKGTRTVREEHIAPLRQPRVRLRLPERLPEQPVTGVPRLDVALRPLAEYAAALEVTP